MYLALASLSTVGRDNSAKYVLVQSEVFDDKKTTASVGQTSRGIVKNGSVSFQRLPSESPDCHRQRDLFASTFPVFLIKQMPRI